VSDSFQALRHFITSKMQMSHVYQPAMLLTLLRADGRASTEEIARHLLNLDISQVQYYEERVKKMVGEVLTKNHGITSKIKDGNKIVGYELNGFNGLSSVEVDELVELLQERLETKQDISLYGHRYSGYEALSGSTRYNVLTRAKHRCELCGISADAKPLDVDHIVPRSKGGSDDESNLQALCYTCNRAKNNKDDTDFRDVSKNYAHRDDHCVFCCDAPARAIAENELALAFLDAYPVTEGHTLIIPKRHVPDYFDLYQPELNAIQQLLRQRKDELQRDDSTITGFNVGVNAGASAGQTVFHCHIHLIPRRDGDVDVPKGGVRGVIPNKQSYC